jgi:hypothetical protein
MAGLFFCSKNAQKKSARKMRLPFFAPFACYSLAVEPFYVG